MIVIVVIIIIIVVIIIMFFLRFTTPFFALLGFTHAVPVPFGRKKKIHCDIF